jgi:hypothetical protein
MLKCIEQAWAVWPMPDLSMVAPAARVSDRFRIANRG